MAAVLVSQFVSAHAATESSAGSRCRWILLAGDSNTRDVMRNMVRLLLGATSPLALLQHYPPASWVSSFDSATADGIDAATCAVLRGVSLCDTKWWDAEHLFGSASGECLVLSFRFLKAPSESARLLTQRDSAARPRVCTHEEYVNISQARCDEMRTLRSCVHRLLPKLRLPSVPDFVYLSHGLWNLPSNRTSCGVRFAADVRTLQSLRAKGSHVAWANHFRITQHGAVRNDDLARENACQQQTARAAWLPVIDLWSRVEQRALQCDERFHLDTSSSTALAKELLNVDSGVAELLRVSPLRPGAQQRRRRANPQGPAAVLERRASMARLARLRHGVNNSNTATSGCGALRRMLGPSSRHATSEPALAQSETLLLMLLMLVTASMLVAVCIASCWSSDLWPLTR